jgi:hypothetical protein
MANEITISGSLRYALNRAVASLSTSYSANQTGDKYQSGVQTVGTSEEVLDKNDVGTIGYLGIRNADDTNFVQVGAIAANYSIKLLPGEGAIMPWKATNVYVKANVASCDMEYLMIEA